MLGDNIQQPRDDTYGTHHWAQRQMVDNFLPPFYPHSKCRPQGSNRVRKRIQDYYDIPETRRRMRRNRNPSFYPWIHAIPTPAYTKALNKRVVFEYHKYNYKYKAPPIPTPNAQMRYITTPAGNPFIPLLGSILRYLAFTSHRKLRIS